MRWLIQKEWLLFFSDPSGALITIFMPALLALLLGTIFQPPGDGSKTRVALVDESGNPTGEAWKQVLEKRPELDVVPMSREDAISEVSRGLMLAAIVVPDDAAEHFRGKRLAEGLPPTIGFLSDPSRSLEASRVRGALRAASADLLFRSFQKDGTLTELLSELSQQMGSIPLPADLRGPLAKSLNDLAQATEPLLAHPVLKAVPRSR